MAPEYRWVTTRVTRRWKTIFGSRRSESVVLIPAKRNARRRTRTRHGRTVTEEWRLVDRATGRVLDGPGQREGLSAREREWLREREHAEQERWLMASMTTEEYGRYLGVPDDEVQRITQRIRGTDHTAQVDAEIDRMKRDLKRRPAQATGRPQTYRATIKFPDGRPDQVCCDTGHDSIAGARSHAEQIAAELGFDT